MSRLPAHHEYERKIVTLARAPGAEQGRGYVTVELPREDDARGMHMKARVKRRKVRRQA